MVSVIKTNVKNLTNKQCSKIYIYFITGSSYWRVTNYVLYVVLILIVVIFSSVVAGIGVSVGFVVPTFISPENIIFEK